jgi:hypothetical protein
MSWDADRELVAIIFESSYSDVPFAGGVNYLEQSHRDILRRCEPLGDV